VEEWRRNLPKNKTFLYRKYRLHLIYFFTRDEKMVRRYPKKCIGAGADSRIFHSREFYRMLRELAPEK